jgi:hypothetical protein
VSDAVQSLPPTSFIKDPHARAFCDALSSAWEVRNGGFGDDSERFVRKSEIASLSSAAVVSLLSGAAASAVGNFTGDSSTDYASAVNAIAKIVTASKAYAFLQTPVQQAAAPTQKLAELQSRISSESADRIAAILAEADARTAAINAQGATLTGSIADLQTQINTIIAAGTSDTATILSALQDEQTARVTADSAEATQRDTLLTAIRGSYTGNDPAMLSEGLIFTERQSRITADGALTTSLSTLSATVAANTASISAEQTARASADTALASSISSISSSLGTTSANLATEQSARSTKDNSLAQAINTIWGSIGGSTALIQDGALAAVSPAAVAASKWTQVQAAVIDPNTGLPAAVSIKQQLDAYASRVDGTLNTTWGVRSNINGIISGITLMTSTGAGSAPGTTTSAFLIQADRLALVSPSNNSLRPVPFSVDGSGNAVFAGWIYAAGGTFAGALNAASGTFAGALSGATGTFSGSLTTPCVYTENIVGAAITQTSSVSSAGTSTSITISIPAGSRNIIVMGFFGAMVATATTGGVSGSTTYIGQFTQVCTGTIGSPLGSVSGVGSTCFVLQDPPAGAYTFTLSRTYQNTSGGSLSNVAYQGNLSAVVLLTKR